ncbi:MAG: TniQ family protein [Gammaproteobacteria bacterium]|nr:TniQ family protein [Gammaproteobacteria bacterium]
MATPVTPIWGESVYSVLTRIHVLEGNASPLATLKAWTGVRGYKPLSGLPTHLEVLAKELSLPEGPMRLIRAHTHFPLYAHFLSVERQKLLIAGMLHAGAPKSRVGLLRNYMGACDRRRYCPTCNELDIERHGVALWRREHTLSGIMVCPEHKSPLLELSSSGRYGERHLALPGLGGRVSIPNDDGVKNRLSYIAREVKILMERPVTALINGSVYRRLFREVGLVTKNGRVRQRRLERLVAEWMRPLENAVGFDRLVAGLKLERSWVAELVDSNDELHHPVKHIILWGTLGINSNDVLNTASALGEQLELALGAYKPIELTRDLIEEILTVTKSFRGAAKLLDVDVTTLMVAAESSGMNVSRRPKKITCELRSVIADEPHSVPSRILASRYNVSVGTINRIRRASGSRSKQITLAGLESI